MRAFQNSVTFILDFSVGLIVKVVCIDEYNTLFRKDLIFVLLSKIFSDIKNIQLIKKANVTNQTLIAL